MCNPTVLYPVFHIKLYIKSKTDSRRGEGGVSSWMCFGACSILKIGEKHRWSKRRTAEASQHSGCSPAWACLGTLPPWSWRVSRIYQPFWGRVRYICTGFCTKWPIALILFENYLHERGVKRRGKILVITTHWTWFYHLRYFYSNIVLPDVVSLKYSAIFLEHSPQLVFSRFVFGLRNIE